MKDNSTERVGRYFLEQIKKVYVERCIKIESFEEYLSHRYRNNCYYYSAYALMGFKPQDYLVRGTITLKDEWVYKNGGYRHGWVEFVFDDEEYVFDSMLETPVHKQEYYDHYKPQISYKQSQKEILDKFLNENCAIKIEDNFWQFKDCVTHVSPKELSYSEIIEYDCNNGYIPSALLLGRIQISKYTNEITRFIAYSEPSG